MLEAGIDRQDVSSPLRACRLPEVLAHLVSPPGLSEAACLDSLIGKRVRLSHLRETGVIDDEIRPQGVEEREKIAPSKLHRSGREKDDRFRLIAKIPDGLMQVRLGVSNVMRFIDYHQIKAWRG